MMKGIFLTILFFLNLNCCSQVDSCNGKDKFDNGSFQVFSKSIHDTVYLKISLRNRISEEFENSDLIRISYKIDASEEYSESYEIKTGDQDNLIEGCKYSLYETIKTCLLEYEKYFFEENIEKIMRLKSNDISYYYYKVRITIIPTRN